MGRWHNFIRPPFRRKAFQRFGVSYYFLTVASIPALVKKVTEGNYQMSSKPWQGVSEEAKDLIRLLLDVNPDNRLATGEVLSHPWMSLDFH